VCVCVCGCVDGSASAGAAVELLGFFTARRDSGLSVVSLVSDTSPP